MVDPSRRAAPAEVVTSIVSPVEIGISQRILLVRHLRLVIHGIVDASITVEGVVSNGPTSAGKNA